MNSVPKWNIYAVVLKPLDPVRSGYCLLIQIVCEGVVPYERDGKGNPIVYDSLQDIQRVLVEGIIERMEEFLAGEREFTDAMTIEEYIAAVSVYPDGFVGDEDGNLFRTDKD